MHLTRITSAKSLGFEAMRLYPKREPAFQTLSYLKQRSSFFVAALSLMAFITGNMMGEHGWYAFWKSVWGKYDDSLIVYTGTVPPIAAIPDYQKWSMYGGDPEDHTYRQVPQDLLVPLPAYDSAKQQASRSYLANLVYSVGDRGSYETGAENGGSHPGIDIRVPVGTPIRSIANGIVTRVGEDKGGFGYYVVVRHPNVPDPAAPTRTTVLHSVYAHLSAQLVAEGDIVSKGQEIALSGQTGFATGPHLHFQIDRDEAPWHPYWPFTSKEASDAGYTFTQAIDAGLNQDRLALYTVNPMVYVQANYAAPTLVADARSSVSSMASVKPTPRTLRERAEAARAERLARLQRTQPQTVVTTSPVVSTKTIVSAVDTPAASSSSSSATSVVSASSAPAASCTSAVQGVRFQHQTTFSGRGWMTVRVRLLDIAGNEVGAECLTKGVYLRTAFGDAEFRPKMLTPADFTNGTAEVQMLPFGKRTVVITAEPYGSMSEPIRYND